MYRPFPFPRATDRNLLRRVLSRLPSCSVILWCATLAPGIAYAEGPTPLPERRFELPILTVDSENRGHCFRPRFTFVRHADETVPLSLAVSEDTPGGAGESIRASMWLAAMVAALDRMDPLAGTKVSLELSGAVDGPSAGAGICLAILSALDGRDFPPDCAATGTIMPDGTIGGVGGIVAKLRAAAAAGIRRVVIPTYVRFEKQPGVAEEVDLKRLAADLKLELIAVDDVMQAYAALHRLAPTPRLPPERSALELPAITEEALKRRYQLHRQAGAVIWDAIPPAEREQLASDPDAKRTFIDDQVNAENAYRTGRLGLAAYYAWIWHIALQARKTHLEYLAKQKPEDLLPQDPATGNALAKRRLTEIAAGVPTPEALLSSQPKGSEAGAQLWVDYFELAGMAGIDDVVQAAVDARLEALKKPELKDEEVKSLRTELFAAYQIQLLLAQIGAEALRTWPQEQASLVATLPSRSIVERPDGVERLFYNAHLAVRNTFRHDVLGSVAAELKQSPSQVLETLKGIDVRLTMQEAAVLAAARVHAGSGAARESNSRRYSLAASAHLHAEALAAQSALIVRWDQLEAEIDAESTLVYGRTDLLNYLITTARENALVALAQCREKELVAIGPITRFETAEMVRDDVGTDKVEVLATYWSASLQAKVLLMLCGSTKNSPPPIVNAPKQAQSVPSTSQFIKGLESSTTILGTPRPSLSPGYPLRLQNRNGAVEGLGPPSYRPPYGNLPARPGANDAGQKSRDSWPGIAIVIGVLLTMNWLRNYRQFKIVQAPPPQIAVPEPSAPKTFKWLPRFAYNCGIALRQFLKLFG